MLWTVINSHWCVMETAQVEDMDWRSDGFLSWPVMITITELHTPPTQNSHENNMAIQRAAESNTKQVENEIKIIIIIIIFTVIITYQHLCDHIYTHTHCHYQHEIICKDGAVLSLFSPLDYLSLTLCIYSGRLEEHVFVV